MFRKSISSVLMASVALAVILAVAAIVTYVSRSTYSLSLELNEQAMQQMAQTTQKALHMYMDNAQNSVRTMASRSSVVAALGGDLSKVDADLKTCLRNDKNLWGVVLFDTTGMATVGLSASGDDLAGKSLSDRDYAKAILGGKDIFLPQTLMKVQSASSSALSFVVAAAVRGADGRLLGGVALYPLWDNFTKAFIDPVRFGQRGYPFMLDGQGRTIAHPTNKAEILAPADEINLKALQVKNGELSYEWKGEKKVIQVTTDPETGWVTCMSAYVSELAETATAQRNMLIGIGAAAVLLLVGVIALIIRRLVVRPITAIEAFTAAIAKGDFTAALATDFRFEFHHLAENIRVMVAELKNKLGFAQGVLKGFVMPCAVFDRDDKVTFTNEHMVRAIDKSGDPTSYHGQTSGQFIYDETGRDTAATRSMRERRMLQAEVPYTSHTGNKKVFDVTATPIHDLDDNVIGTLAVWFELTEIREQEKKIAAQNEKIAKAAEAADTVSDQVASASEELSAQIEQSSRGSEEQRSRTGEAATAMEEMNATVMEVAKSASTAAELADKAKSQAQDGEQLVRDVVATITRINEQSEVLRTDMTELGKQAEGIGQIMNVIADIADQTNLLALNAAIEAARAGEAGRGFAVVADEVRKLAEKTMTATNEVGAYIKAVQDSARKNIQNTEATAQAIHESTSTAEKSGAALREIVNMVEKTADQVRGIATASEEQSAASEQISRSTEEINRIAAETAEAMTQSAQAVSDLSRLAQDLKSIITDMQQ
ncbi:methyl-accepting chemotaxis protein [Desulfovibrio aminophilus]|uniref:methyl-accepting chemotaxis protein n=1 Tax=Desulfovibrio aminophilus TaxID=81425 RepID=UPI0003F4E81A|nr:methyl-accepting chemotaxis protein [Desulfovibrio aminophilus]